MTVSFTLTRTTTRFHDSNGNGFKDAGEQDFDLVDPGVYDPGEILYTRIKITNTGNEPATGVTVADDFTGSTMVDAGGVAATFMNISPIAFNDTFQAIGNTVFRVGTANTINSGESTFFAGNVISNDVGNLTADGIQGFQLDAVTNGVTAKGGTFNLYSDGTFNYVNDGDDTAADLVAGDSFTYTIRDKGFDGVYNTADDLTSTATVRITFAEQSAGVPHRVWYVDSAAAPGGDGTSANPFQTMAALNGAGNNGAATGDLDQAGEYIYVENSGSPAVAVTGPITLENGQKLIGDGAALVVAGITLATAGTNSTLTAASGTVVTLGSGNTIAGIDIAGTGSAIGMFGSNFGALSVSNVAVSTATGAILNLSTGTSSGISFNSLTSTGTVTGNAPVVRINDLDNGTFNANSLSIAGSSDVGSAGLQIIGGSSATFTFGATTIANTRSASIDLDGANGSVTFSSVALSGSVAGAGLKITNATNAVTVSGGSITAEAPVDAVQISGGSGAVTVAATISKANAGNVVDISGHSGGTVAFSGNITGSNAAANGISIANSSGTINFTSQSISLTTGVNNAVELTNNTGATINFSPAAGGGGLDISTTSGKGFTATGGGTITVQGTSNTISSTTGTALEVVNTNIGANDLTFVSIGSNGGSSTGIILDTTGSDGGLHVTGNGAAGSGGTIANKTGADGSTSTGIGIYLNSTADVQLASMQLNGFDNFGIRGTQVNGFSLSNSVVEGTGAGKNGNNNAFDEGSISFGNVNGTNGLIGTATITNTKIHDGFENGFALFNTSGTVNLVMDNVDVTGAGNDGILTQNFGTATVNFEVKNSEIYANVGDHFNATADNAANLNVLFGNNGKNVLTGGAAGALGQGITIQTGIGWSGSGSANISNNEISGAVDTPVNVNIGGTGTFNASIINNIIGKDGVAGSGTPVGSNKDAIRIVANGDKATDATPDGGTLNVLISGNTIQQVAGRGIYVIGRDGGTAADPIRLNVTIIGNTLRQSLTSSGQGILLESGASSSGGVGNVSDYVILHADIGGAGARVNTFSDDWGVNNPLGFDPDEIRLINQIANNRVLLTGYAGGPTDDAAVRSYLAGRNSFAAGGQAGTSRGSTKTWETGGTPTQPISASEFSPLPLELYQLAAAEGEPAGGPADPPTVGSGDTAAAPSGPVVIEDGVLSQAELDLIVEAAIQRWAAAGATDDQIAAMRAVSISVADLAGMMLGKSDAGTITLDSDAAGWRWFIDSTPGDDSEYAGSGTRLAAVDSNGLAGTRIDLLTVITHELGHQIGLSDSYASGESDELMYGTIGAGERRLPGNDDLAGAADGPVTGAFAFAPITLDTIPAGQTVIVEFRHTIDNPGEDRLVGAWKGQTTLDSATTDPQVSNVESGNVDGLTLGDLIFNDVNKNGVYDSGDGVLAGVTLRIYGDTNNNNLLDAGDLYVGYNEIGGGAGYQQGVDTPAAPGQGTPLTATSNASGLYSFSSLAPGDYIVQIDASNFAAGGALAGYRGVFGGVDPDGSPDVDNDDNGVPGLGGSVASNAVTLAYNTEPTAGTGNDTNNRLDFGFVLNSAPVANADAVGATEDTQAQYSTQLTGNDTDVDLDTLTITAVSNFVNGSGSVTNGVVSFTPTANFNGTASFTYTISDGNGHTASATATVTVGAANDPVTTAAPATATMNEDAVDHAVTGMSISDVDAALAPSGVYVVTLSATQGTLKLSTTTGLTFSAGDGDGDTTMTFRGTLADVNAALATAKYSPNANYNGSAQIGLQATDEYGAAVATGTGSATSDSDTVAVTVNSVNDEPKGTDDSASVSAGVPYKFTVADFQDGFSDPNDPNSFAGVKITELPLAGTLKLDGVAIAVNDVVSLADLTAQKFTYESAGDATGSASFKFAVKDNGGDANGGVEFDQSPNVFTLNVAPANVAPALDLDGAGGGTGFASAYTEGGAAAAISDSDVDITDGDSNDDIVSATITITNPETGDILNVGTLPATVTVDGTSTATTVKLVAAAGTSAADFESAIKAITYSNTGDDPTDKGTNTSRSISVVVNDGTANSNVATATVSVTDVNDNPTIDNLQDDNVGFTGGSSAPQFADAGGNASVIDDSPNFDTGTLTVEITGNEVAAEDVLFFAENADYKFDATNIVYQNSVIIASWSGGSPGDPWVFTFRPGATAAHVSAVMRLVTYENTNQTDPSTAQRTLTWTLTDGDGGSKAVTSTITVTGINAAPVLTTPSPIAATEQTAVAILPAGSVADANLDALNGGAGDYAGSTFSVNRNPATNASEDVFTLVAGPNFTIDGSNLKSGGSIFGTINVDGSAGLIVIKFTSLQTKATSALVDEVIQAVRYTNISNNPPASVDLAVGFDDGATGGGQGTVISGNNLDVNVVTVDIAAINDAPVNSVGATVSTGEDVVGASLGGMSISDPDADPATDKMLITFKVLNGTLNLSTGVTNGIVAGDITGQSAGTITVLATLNKINATLADTNGLTYSPNANYNGNDTLTVTTNDKGANGTDPGLSGNGTSEEDADTRAITVEASDDLAVARDDAVSTLENAIGTGDLFASNGSGADSDVENDPFVITQITVGAQNYAPGTEIVLPSGAKLVVNANGTYSYNPNGKFDKLTDSSSGAVNTSATETFSYTVTGGDTATVTVRVDGVAGPGDWLMGNSADNTINGTPQDDFFFVNQGGDDDLSGMAGNDVFYFGGEMTSGDDVDGGEGLDQIVLQGNYSGGLVFGTEVLSIESIAILPGSDTRGGDTANNLYDYDITTVDENVGQGQQLIVDANRLRDDEDFTFDGSAETDGTFLIYGGLGDDDLTGGAKNDIFLFGIAGQWGSGDKIAGGGGLDQLALRGDYTIVFGADQLESIESFALISAYDTRFGALGERYSYTLTMNDGNVASGGQLTVDGAKLRSDESLTFTGSAESNGTYRVFGGQGDDVIVGGKGADTIGGGLGQDSMTGGQGNDTFRFSSIADSPAMGNRDSIQDFALGDIIDLSRIDADSTAGAPGNQAFSFIGTDAFHGVAGELRFQLSSGNIWLVQGDTDGNGQSDFEFFVVVTDIDPITSGDFIL
jgi:hypothetical protein